MMQSLHEDLARAANLSDHTAAAHEVLQSPQGVRVRMRERGEVLVLSSNNYLGLAAHPAVVAASRDALQTYGFGTASVRFICGTFEPHVALERQLAALVRTEAATTYVSCWNANQALITALADNDTAVFSDELNHASIIDAIRLSRTRHRAVYKHADLVDLTSALEAHRQVKRKLIITDGVFSMEGSIAPLPDLVEVAERYNAAVIVDDSHGTGVLGETGRGSIEHFGLDGRIDAITSTLGKALGGAAGGFVASSRALCAYLEQRSRPYIFSNSLSPAVAAGAGKAVEVMLAEPQRLARLRSNIAYLRASLSHAGFPIPPGETAILPVILGQTSVAKEFSRELLRRGVFVTGFGYPVVPEGSARIRIQVSSTMTREDMDEAVDAITASADALKVERGRQQSS